MTLTEFLLERIAEDEATARVAASQSPPPTWPERAVGEHWVADRGLVAGRAGDGLWDCEGSATLCMAPETAVHIARHDPARVLAECEAKRRIVALHSGYGRDHGDETSPCDTLSALALPYADHPDYRDEWRA